MTTRSLPRLNLVTPETPTAAVLEATRAVVAAHEVFVQVRTKGVDDRARLAFARELVEVCHAADTICLINDRADIALASGADGVHLGDEDLPVEVVRSILGPEAIIGATCRIAETGLAAQAAGASYLGCGPAYLSTTKIGLPNAMGPAGIAAVADAVDIPVVGISGVTASNAGALTAVGAHGVAVVAAVYSAADPAAAAGELIAAIEGGRA